MRQTTCFGHNEHMRFKSGLLLAGIFALLLLLGVKLDSSHAHETQSQSGAIKAEQQQAQVPVPVVRRDQTANDELRETCDLANAEWQRKYARPLFNHCFDGSIDINLLSYNRITGEAREEATVNFFNASIQAPEAEVTYDGKPMDGIVVKPRWSKHVVIVGCPTRLMAAGVCRFSDGPPRVVRIIQQ